MSHWETLYSSQVHGSNSQLFIYDHCSDLLMLLCFGIIFTAFSIAFGYNLDYAEHLNVKKISISRCGSL